MNCFQIDHFLQLHQNQLEASSVPSLFWRCLFNKLKQQKFDAGDYFKIELIDNENDYKNVSHRVVVIDQQGISTSNENHIFLVDHFWTYRLEQCKTQLLNNPNLRQRCSLLFNVEDLDANLNEVVDEILKKIWLYNQCYSIKCDNPEDSLPIWYLMDEFGSRITHSLKPNFRCVPFYFIYQKMTYSLLFPIQDVKFGEAVTRNFIEGGLIQARDILFDDIGNDESHQKESKQKLIEKALLVPWNNCDLSYIDCSQFINNKFFSLRRIEESQPLANAKDLNSSCFDSEHIFTVYTDYQNLKNFLNHSKFRIINSLAEADIWWITTHFKNYQQFSKTYPKKYINQFPFEHVLTVKDLFAITARRKHPQVIDHITLNSKPDWLATTYNLQTELVQFVSFFQKRANKKLDNHWIIKPWNLARGLDTVVTNNLSAIIRLRSSGPKIACKYIHDPVLFKRQDVNGLVKFDVRYIILVKSVKPLKIFVYKKFWLRFANKSFSLTDLDDYEKHFTVMNYGQYSLKKMYCENFIQQFEEIYAPDHKWSQIELEIFSSIKEAFECAILASPPAGLCHSPQSRAMYAVDIMLKWEKLSESKKKMVPVILEINWSPDCQRACLYYPNFFNDVFSVLFLDQEENCNILKL